MFFSLFIALFFGFTEPQTTNAIDTCPKVIWDEDGYPSCGCGYLNGTGGDNEHLPPPRHNQ